ncbi:forkhead box protein Q1 [Ailuropoda melanoleuca]|uniref:forkhead box protein Q1 n=1 Tax=Ailuropoda melanoleuca TaxID=9646 RepID=UPI00149440EE|nr:forkhead box protein Q1 [Ailuropoda melanoleuca]
MKLEAFGPRAAHGDKPGNDLEGAGCSNLPSPLSAAGDDSLGSDGDCAANSPAAGGGAGELAGSGERSAGGRPGAEEEGPAPTAAPPPPAPAASASPGARSPARQEGRSSPAGKFSSSFAIDSILSKPFRSRRDGEAAPGARLPWGASPCPTLPTYPALLPSASGGALLPLCAYGATEPALLGARGADAQPSVPPATPHLLLGPLSASGPAKPFRGPAAGGGGAAHLYCPLRLPAALQAASSCGPGPHLPYPVETLLA